MKHALSLALTLTASALPAWEFSANPVCTLYHAEMDGTMTLTYDPRQVQPYTIAVVRTAGWTPATIFSIRFSGGNDLIISTDRHVLDGDTLRVSDRGFGNVLNGLEFSKTAKAIAGDSSFSVSLDGAAEPVQAFRACTDGVV